MVTSFPQAAIDAARANPFRAFVGSVASGAGAGVVVGMVGGALAGLAARRMQLGLTLVTRGVGLGSVVGAGLSAASFASEGRFTASHPAAPAQAVETGGRGEHSHSKHELLGQLEALRRLEKESGRALDSEKLQIKRRLRSL